MPNPTERSATGSRHNGLKGYDVAVVGGGIVGLALAYESARRGLRVGLFERDGEARGATVRNFGMIWPIGQPEATLDRAMRARATWLDLAERAGFWAAPWGSLHLAYHEDELYVLKEFVATGGGRGQILTPEEAVERSPAVRPVGLEGAMYSPSEVNIDPRQATRALRAYLEAELGVAMHYSTAITRVEYPVLCAGASRWKAERIYICSGADFQTLYPEIHGKSGMVPCKLQMMRTAPQPDGYQLGPNLAAGLTLLHYASFAHCASLQPLRQRLERDLRPWLQHGIHVLVSQTSRGEITLGDSHAYGPGLDPFCRTEINELILKYLFRFAQFPEPRIAETWQGTYAKLPGQSAFIAEPEPHVCIVNGLGGAGMTLSFGLAEDILAERVAAQSFSS